MAGWSSSFDACFRPLHCFVTKPVVKSSQQIIHESLADAMRREGGLLMHLFSRGLQPTKYKLNHGYPLCQASSGSDI